MAGKSEGGRVCGPQAGFLWCVAYSYKMSVCLILRCIPAQTDERLMFFLIHRLESPESSTPTNTLSPESSTPQPPALLLSYLSHLQVSYEASYIPQQYPSSPGPPGTAHPNPPLTARSPVPPLASPLLSATRPASTGPPASASLHLSAPPPPRPSSLAPPVQSYSLPPPQTQGHKARGHVPPSIVPPVTPHPTPSTRVEDRRYAGANVREQGVLLVGGIWGEERDGRKSLSNGTVFEKGRQSAEEAEQKEESRFQLLWDEKDGVWVAVYKLWIDVGATFSVSFISLLPIFPILEVLVFVYFARTVVGVRPHIRCFGSTVSSGGVSCHSGRVSIYQISVNPWRMRSSSHDL